MSAGLGVGDAAGATRVAAAALRARAGGPVTVGVLASGGGTNLQALIDRLDATVARVGLVLADRPDAFALERGRAAGARTLVIPVVGRVEEEVAAETLAALEGAGVGLIALAGYIRLVPPAVVRAYAGRMLNIHPALLPGFGGKGMWGHHVHEAVLAARCRVSGVTVHLVDEQYDRGPIVAQWPVPVHDGDTAETLAARVLRVEHLLYPAVVEAAARTLAAGGDIASLRCRYPEAFGAAGEPDAAAVRAALGLD